MTRITVIRLALVTAVFLSTSLAHAGQRGGGRDSDRGNPGRSAEAREGRGGGVVVVSPRAGAPVRAYPVAPRRAVAVGVAPRVAVPRVAVPRVVVPRAVVPRAVAPRVYVAPRFYRPYYSFRPRVSVGLGLWAGYPVAYPRYYGYPYGYAYAAPGPYGYAYPAAIPYGYVAPGYGDPAPNPYPSSPYTSTGYPPIGSSSSSYPAAGLVANSAPVRQLPPNAAGVQGTDPVAAGGVSLDITPSTAAVLVDGTFVGTAADFGPTSQPLGLTPGRHHIELRASGYQSLVFDTEVTSGQVIPYQGTLQAPRN